MLGTSLKNDIFFLFGHTYAYKIFYEMLEDKRFIVQKILI